jgi:hypothetical protein
VNPAVPAGLQSQNLNQWAFGLNDNGQVISRTTSDYNSSDFSTFGQSLVNYVTSAGVTSPIQGSILGPQIYSFSDFSHPAAINTYAIPETINNNGQIAANVAQSNTVGYQTYYGIVQNADGSTKVLAPNTQIGGAYMDNNRRAGFGPNLPTNGLNNRGDVTGSQDFYVSCGSNCSSLDHTSAFYQASASSTATIINPLGFGGTGTALNLTGQVTGGLLTTQSFNYESPDDGFYSSGVGFLADPSKMIAFETGANGTGIKYLGLANGIGSEGFAINDQGQVGGEIVLASGQTEAFLTTTHGGMVVGLGAGAPGDSTATLFVNNLGQAIIIDATTESYYLYSAGKIIPIESLLHVSDFWGFAVITGFNNNGDILVGDPIVLNAPTDWNAINGTDGVVDVTSTLAYQQISAAQGGATPGASFFTLSPSDDSGGSSVPEPATFGLLGLGALFARGLRRKARTA